MLTQKPPSHSTPRIDHRRRSTRFGHFCRNYARGVGTAIGTTAASRSELAVASSLELILGGSLLNHKCLARDLLRAYLAGQHKALSVTSSLLQRLYTTAAMTGP